MSFISTRHVDSVSVSSTGQLALGLSSLDGNIWDGGITLLSNEGNEICSKILPTGVSMVRFAGPRIVVAARDDGDVAVYSSEDLKELRLISAHDDIVSCVAIDPHHENQFASCGWDGSIYLWDWNNANPQKQTPLQSYILAHHGHVNELTFSLTNAHVLSSVGQDGFLRVWDLREKSAANCACIVDLGQVGSCVVSTLNDHALLVGTDAGRVMTIDIRSVSSSSSSSSSSKDYDGTPSTTPMSVGIVSMASLHRTRVRRILSLDHVTDMEGMFVSASDDMSYAISHLHSLPPSDQEIQVTRGYAPLSLINERKRYYSHTPSQHTLSLTRTTLSLTNGRKRYYITYVLSYLSDHPVFVFSRISTISFPPFSPHCDPPPPQYISLLIYMTVSCF